MQITASHLFFSKQTRAPRGSSKLPGTSMRKILSRLHFAESNVLYAPSKSASVISLFHDETTIPILSEAAEGTSAGLNSDTFFFGDTKNRNRYMLYVIRKSAHITYDV